MHLKPIPKTFTCLRTKGWCIYKNKQINKQTNVGAIREAKTIFYQTISRKPILITDYR